MAETPSALFFVGSHASLHRSFCPDSRSRLERPRFPVVGVGASAGGLVAIIALLEGLPNDWGMALVVVMHLSSEHESMAAEILQGATGMRVQQVQGCVAIRPNTVYVIPPAHDLAMVDGHLQLSDPVRSRGRAIVIDRFFRTLADVHGGFRDEHGPLSLLVTAGHQIIHSAVGAPRSRRPFPGGRRRSDRRSANLSDGARGQRLARPCGAIDPDAPEGASSGVR